MNRIGTYSGSGNVRFGSQAALQPDFIRMAASGTNPAVHETNYRNPNLNGCFPRKRSFRSLNISKNEGRLSAKSGAISSHTKQTCRKLPYLRLLSVTLSKVKNSYPLMGASCARADGAFGHNSKCFRRFQSKERYWSEPAVEAIDNRLQRHLTIDHIVVRE